MDGEPRNRSNVQECVTDKVVIPAKVIQPVLDGCQRIFHFLEYIRRNTKQPSCFTVPGCSCQVGGTARDISRLAGGIGNVCRCCRVQIQCGTDDATKLAVYFTDATVFGMAVAEVLT